MQQRPTESESLADFAGPVTPICWGDRASIMHVGKKLFTVDLQYSSASSSPNLATALDPSLKLSSKPDRTVQRTWRAQIRLQFRRRTFAEVPVKLCSSTNMTSHQKGLYAIEFSRG